MSKQRAKPGCGVRAAYKARWYRLNRSRLAARQRRYYKAHREEIAAYQRRYNKVHREEVAARQRRYQQTHREELAAYQRKRRGFKPWRKGGCGRAPIQREKECGK